MRIKFPFVNYALLGANVAIFCVFQSGLVYDQNVGKALNVILGLIPVEITSSHQVIPNLDLFPETVTLFSHMFLHGNWGHLAANMLFLWVFGDNVEDALGHARYLLFYLLCGVAGGLVHILLTSHPSMPLIGASGAVAGNVGAFLFLHPRVQLWCLVFNRYPLRINAGIALMGWIGTQLYYAFWLPQASVAWWAHIGGFLAGVGLVMILRKPGVPLFDKDLSPAPPAGSR